MKTEPVSTDLAAAGAIAICPRPGAADGAEELAARIRPTVCRAVG
jgi:hypothetical protein